MIAALHKLATDAKRRATMAIARGVLSAIDDSKQAQEVQIQLLADETADQIERFQQYGFTSVPYPDAEAVVVCPGGLRSHAIVIAVEDRRYRLTSLVGGEVALYDDQGQTIHLKRDGIHLVTSLKVVVDAGGDVDVTAGGNATITAASLALGGAGGPAVARIGDTVAGGVITSGSAKVTCS